MTDFLAFLQGAFAARRKQLKGAAAALHTTPDKISKSLVALGIAPTARAEALTPKQLIDLFHLLKEEASV